METGKALCEVPQGSRILVFDTAGCPAYIYTGMFMVSVVGGGIQHLYSKQEGGHVLHSLQGRVFQTLIRRGTSHPVSLHCFLLTSV